MKSSFEGPLVAMGATVLALLSTAPAVQAYIDPPVKLGAESGNINTSTGLLNESSPRKISGADKSATTEALYESEIETSPDDDPTVVSELEGEGEELLKKTDMWDWRLVPDAAAVASAGYVGWEIGSAIWGLFFEEGSTSGGPAHDPANRWHFAASGERLLLEGAAAIYAPGWGLVGHSTGGPYGEQFKTGSCNLDLYGAGEPLYLPVWFNEPGVCNSEYREYVRWKSGTALLCNESHPCPGISPTKYTPTNQPTAPKIEKLKEEVKTELETKSFPVLNRFENHELEPEDFPDPRITKKTVDEEERRCDRGAPSFENAGGNALPDPFAKKEEGEYMVTSPPESVTATPVYLRWGTTSWIPGKPAFTETPYLDLWSGWGYRHIVSKHGWNVVDREETELALATPQIPEESTSGNWVYSTTAIPIGVGGVECERQVVVDFDPGEGDPASRGIVTSFNVVNNARSRQRRPRSL